MQVNNWDYNNLKLDFGSMYVDKDHPGDIDLFYIARDNTLLIGEIKNERGRLKVGQRGILERLANGWKYNAMVLFIRHDSYVQRGAKSVNVGDCYVDEVFIKKEGAWRYPKRPITVKEVIDIFRRKNGK